MEVAHEGYWCEILHRMQAVRTVFNIAIGADSADIQRTARSALLQMLNTIVKRITIQNTIVRESAHTPFEALSVGPSNPAV